MQNFLVKNFRSVKIVIIQYPDFKIFTEQTFSGFYGAATPKPIISGDFC